MASPSQQLSEVKSNSIQQNSTENSGFRGVVFLQLILLASLIAILWRILGPEPISILENRFQVVGFGLIHAAALVTWVFGLKWTFAAKVASIVLGLLVIVWSGYRMTTDYNTSVHILESAVVNGDRISYEALGFSFKNFPDAQSILQPTIRPKVAPAGKLTQGTSGAVRLSYSLSAMLGRIQWPQLPGTQAPNPATLIIEVEHNRARVLNRFIRDVQEREDNIKNLIPVTFSYSSRAVKFAGLDGIEFEFSDSRQGLISRHVHVQAGRFILTFTFNCGDRADMVRFDEFLSSIRIVPQWDIPVML